MTRSADNPPHFSLESDQAPSGDTTKQSEPTPSASACNFLDPDTHSSDSTGSLREQLCLVNQRIDDVRRTLRTKDEHAEGPLHGSPFFEGNFLSSARPKPTAASLLKMRQKEEEHLRQYLARFTDKVRVIPDAHPSLVIQAVMIGIKPSRLFLSFVEQPLITVPSMLQRANQYVNAETLVIEKHEDQKRPRGEPSWGPPSGLPMRRMERGEQTVPWPPNVSLNSTRTEIFL
ncbi:hypothetical protein BHE74_00039203 [Ensete ventricosum]|nr:hypothetical protein BHE74_00039203 [Ensete ventricosum]